MVLAAALMDRRWANHTRSELAATPVGPALHSVPVETSWVGSGLLRTWGFGVIGHERVFLRLDHVTNPDLWLILEVSRRRYGFGLGVERQMLAAIATDASPDALLDLVPAAFDDVDKAFRPGFSPVRTLRSLALPRAARKSRRLLYVQSSIEGLATGPNPSQATAIQSLLNDWPDLANGEGTLRLSVTGPTVMVGFWTGRGRPYVDLLTSSGCGFEAGSDWCEGEGHEHDLSLRHHDPVRRPSAGRTPRRVPRTRRSRVQRRLVI